MPPVSLNPDPISDQTMSFSIPVFRPGLKAEIISSVLRLERKQTKIIQMNFEFAYLLTYFYVYWLKSLSFVLGNTCTVSTEVSGLSFFI